MSLAGPFGTVVCQTSFKIDEGKLTAANGLKTAGWEWVKLTSVNLKPGKQMLTMAYREDGALVDRISWTTYPFGPSALEGESKYAREK